MFPQTDSNPVGPSATATIPEIEARISKVEAIGHPNEVVAIGDTYPPNLVMAR
jgi:hypothetical protein